MVVGQKEIKYSAEFSNWRLPLKALCLLFLAESVKKKARPIHRGWSDVGNLACPFQAISIVRCMECKAPYVMLPLIAE